LAGCRQNRILARFFRVQLFHVSNQHWKGNDMEKTNTLLTGLLLRLAVELESDCMAAVEAGGNVLDVPVAWLDSHGFGYLAPYPRALDEPLRLRKVCDFDPLTLTAAARVVRNALFVADEILQLDGEPALEYVAGWIGGSSMLSIDDPAHYLENFADFVPVYRDLFVAGFRRGYEEMRTLRRQGERKSTEGSNHEAA
jgi:hypothetical protein